MQDFQRHVTNEKDDLDLKISSLTDFIKSGGIFNDLDSGEQKRLKRQREVMIEYSDILDARISAFN